MKKFDKDHKNKHKEEFADDAKLTLHEERLDIDKDRVKTGEVNLRKDVLEQHKSVDVPVTHDEVIIESRAFEEQSDTPISDKEETYHIPTSRDEVHVGKHTMVTGQVEAHKKEFTGTQKVDETLKKEEADIDADGHPRIKKKDKFHH